MPLNFPKKRKKKKRKEKKKMEKKKKRKLLLMKKEKKKKKDAEKKMNLKVKKKPLKPLMPMLMISPTKLIPFWKKTLPLVSIMPLLKMLNKSELYLEPKLKAVGLMFLREFLMNSLSILKLKLKELKFHGLNSGLTCATLEMLIILTTMITLLIPMLPTKFSNKIPSITLYPRMPVKEKKEKKKKQERNTKKSKKSKKHHQKVLHKRH